MAPRRRTVWMGLALAAATLFGACAGDNDVQPAGMVTLDVFSGRPNPTWELSPGQTTELMAMWAALPVGVAGEYPGTLGYRAVGVELDDGSRLWATGGLAVEESATATVYRRDDGRLLERWLIETGRGQADNSILDEVLGSIP